MHFISNAVMIGFLTGVSFTIIQSQLGEITGYSSELPDKVMKALDTLLHLRQINPQTTAIGLLTVFRSKYRLR